jgi:hypothetical protein
MKIYDEMRMMEFEIGKLRNRIIELEDLLREALEQVNM